ncbi:MAG: Na+ dependent nucleoside transporter N-terminal domain-containing protein, partial [Pyrinomonadaceae bacterium]
MARLSGLLGFFLLLGIAFALSTNRKAISWRTVFWGITLQLSCALVVLKGDWLAHGFDWLPLSLRGFLLAMIGQLLLLRLFSKALAGRSQLLPKRILIFIAVELLLGLVKFNLIARFFAFMREVVNRLIAYSGEGAKFVFGSLGSEQGERSIGFVFAFQVLPTI